MTLLNLANVLHLLCVFKIGCLKKINKFAPHLKKRSANDKTKQVRQAPYLILYNIDLWFY